MASGQDQIPPHLPVSIEQIRGATVQSFYATRQMRIYPVAEHEVSALTAMNTVNAVLFGVGVALISLAVGIWVAESFTEKVGPEGHILSAFGAPVLIVIGALCFVGCIWTNRKRGSIWGEIAKSSKEV